MADTSTTILKISFNLYGKEATDLTQEERDKVMEIYYDFY